MQPPTRARSSNKAKTAYEAALKSVNDCVTAGQKLESKLMDEVSAKMKSHASSLEKLMQEKLVAYAEYEAALKAESIPAAVITGSRDDQVNMSFKTRATVAKPNLLVDPNIRADEFNASLQK